MGTPLTAPDRGRHRSRSHCRCTTVPDVPASPRGTSVAARLVQAVGRARQAPTFRRRRGRGGRSDSRTTMHGSKGPIAGVIRGPGVASIALPATAPEHRRRVGSAAWAPPRGLRRVGSAAWAPPRGLRRVGTGPASTGTRAPGSRDYPACAPSCDGISHASSVHSAPSPLVTNSIGCDSLHACSRAPNRTSGLCAPDTP
jgi:hypothetical protein